MNLYSAQSFRLALADLAGGIENWRIWYWLGLNEIRQRYRRSTLGPFWLTISQGVQAAVIGLVFGVLFKTDIERFLPFVVISLILWNFIATICNESAMGFISVESLITQVNRPLSVHILHVIWRNLLIFAHTIAIYFIIAPFFGIYPGVIYIFGLAGFGLLVLNVLWVALAAAIISARYRDVPMIIQNAFTVLFWLTPILYMPSQISGKLYVAVALLNPLAHIIEVARAPFLGLSPSALNWGVTIGCAIIGWAFTLVLFARTRSRIPYWL